uniref:Uncharacterized protein n=1 Tax=Oncorhynchus mykiss TaxID=8022 RepID=A0A8K9X3P6_ONCMY
MEGWRNGGEMREGISLMMIRPQVAASEDDMCITVSSDKERGAEPTTRSSTNMQLLVPQPICTTRSSTNMQLPVPQPICSYSFLNQYALRLCASQCCVGFILTDVLNLSTIPPGNWETFAKK